MDGTTQSRMEQAVEHADLLIVGVVALCSLVVALFVPARQYIPSILFAPLLVFLLPGYGVVAAAFPSSASLLGAPQVERGVDDGFRLALAGTTSVLLSGLLGIAMHLLGISLTAQSVATVMSAVTIGAVVVAGIRRARCPEADRYTPQIATRIDSVRRTVSDSDRVLTQRLLPVVVILTVLIAMGLVGVTAESANNTERYTEISVLNPGGSGSPTAGEFPRSVSSTESIPVVIGVENDEHRTVTYTLVVSTQRTAVRDDQRRVVETSEHDRFSFTLGAGESWSERYNYQPPAGDDDDVRVAFLLYRGTVPERPTVDSAYREVHFWTDIVTSADP
jgi:uncharacterized membrane protein